MAVYSDWNVKDRGGETHKDKIEMKKGEITHS